MKKVIILIGLISLFAISQIYSKDGQYDYSKTVILTGIVLLTAYLLALLLKNAKLPKLTSYMIMGMILGPLGLKFLNYEILEDLKFLESLALSFIAITAGGEFKYKRIKKYIKAVFSLLAGQIVFVFFGMFLFLFMTAEYIPFLKELDSNMIIGFSILLAGTALSTSPATTMGIITEVKSKGKMTDVVLSLTVLKSISLVIVFPLIIIWSKFYLVKGTAFNVEMLLSLFTQIFGSALLGVLLGLFVIWYLKTIKTERSIFLLGIAVVITEFSTVFNVEILLTSIITGIIVENFSEKGEQLIKGIEQSSLPFYIIFFCFAGAGLHLETLQKAFVLTAFLVIIRMLLMYAGNLAGAIAVNEDKNIKNLSWLGFVAQAGIAVGLGTIIENTFPGEIGSNFKTILLSSVVINELIGPIFLKYILVKSKETAA